MSLLDFFKRRPQNVKNDVLSGLTVALALVPEAVAFAFVAGVSPVIGLYSAFFIGLLAAVVGGRPGMISARPGRWRWWWCRWSRCTALSTCSRR